MDNNYEDDPELLKGISEGDAGALASFLDVNRRQLMAFISRRLGDALRTKVEVEDIFQDVSAEAIRTLTPEWPGENGNRFRGCVISQNERSWMRIGITLTLKKETPAKNVLWMQGHPMVAKLVW